jgi:hypothetical protein
MRTGKSAKEKKRKEKGKEKKESGGKGDFWSGTIPFRKKEKYKKRIKKQKEENLGLNP